MRLVQPRGRLLAGAVVALVSTFAGPAARADDAPSVVRVVPDRTALRFVAPETGGVAHPRFVTARELGFFVRLEALNEGVTLGPDEYPDRYVRSATDRIVARAMLASLMIERGTEPPDLPKLADEARSELADRVGGSIRLEDTMKREGIAEDELDVWMRDLVRATYYIDKGITPILGVTEDALRETYRSALHPFRSLKFDDARGRLRRWVVAERERAAEIEFLQGARARVKVVVVQAADDGDGDVR